MSDLWGALFLFCAVTLVTPGPNNVMLMASGLNFALRRSLPHLFGVAVGFAAMVALVGLGLASVFAAYPALYQGLKFVGAAYLLWLAWAIARSGPVEVGEGSGGRPLTFLEAAAFQWVNPKAWVMAIGAVTTYAGVASFPFNVLAIAGVFCGLGLVSCLLWVGFGAGLRSVITDPRQVRWVNIAMALLLVASLWPILAEVLAWRA